MGAAVAVFVVWCLLPEIVGHVLGVGAVRRGPPGPRVALTFDDGPDPQVTPQVLDLLAQSGARATFCVVGQRLAQQPDLARRLLAEGHELAAHSWSHRHPWTIGPLAAVREVTRSAAAVRDVTSGQLRWYRPPKGMFNLATAPTVVAAGLQMLLWSGTVGDWDPGATPDAVTRRALRALSPGAILDFHDGGPGAAAGLCLLALPTVLATIRQRGWEAVTVSELCGTSSRPPGRDWLLRLWQVWENLFSRLAKTREISPGSLFRIALCHHQGPPVTLADGSQVRRGDRLVEVHVRNELVLEHRGEPGNRAIIRLGRQARQSLVDLAQLLDTDPELADVKAAWARTLMAPGARWVGFEARPVPRGLSTWWFETYERWLWWLYNPRGHTPTHRRLMEVWLARSQLAGLATAARRTERIG